MKHSTPFPASFLRAAIVSALASLSIGAAALAQAQTVGSAATGSENGITLYGGYRTGGTLTEATTGQDVKVGNFATVALAVDFALEPRKQVQLFYSRQQTDLSSGGFLVSTGSIPLRIEYFHLGGTAFFEDVGSGGYAVGGLGVTIFTPKGQGLTSEIKPSINVGFGYMLPLGRNLGVRFEARGYATLIDSSGGFFCGGSTCAVSIKGTALYQAEGLVGLTGRF